MTSEFRLLLCPHCGERKVINVAVNLDGSLGPVECEDCKLRELRRRSGTKAA